MGPQRDAVYIWGTVYTVTACPQVIQLGKECDKPNVSFSLSLEALALAYWSSHYRVIVSSAGFSNYTSILYVIFD